MGTVEYDFLTWTSFPSSIKIVNTQAEPGKLVWAKEFVIPNVVPGRPLTLKVKIKVKDVIYSHSNIPVTIFDGKKRVYLGAASAPLGTHDWREYSVQVNIPKETVYVVSNLAGGAGTPDRPGISWFDDLKIYQDDKLIYANDFSNWNPYIGAGAGAAIGAIAGYFIKPLGPIVSEAVLALAGAGLGGGIGYVTAKP